jgi:cytochrome c biogenesis protein CcdA
MLKKFGFVFIILFFLYGLSYAQNKSFKKDKPHLLFFYSPTCHACHRVIEEIMPQIEKEFSGQIIIEYLDTTDINNYKMMIALKEKYDCKEAGVPTIFLEGNILVGYTKIKNELRKLIIDILNKGSLGNHFKPSTIDLVSRFLSFGILTIITAGLIDGINPCAFTVIVFFISFLAVQGYRRRDMEIVGLSFIFAVFLTYVLIGVGIFHFLYSLRHFYLISKILYYAIAGLCFILAGFSLYDLWLFKKTEKFEGMTLKLPQRIKDTIHYIIGLYYRKKGKSDNQETTGEKRISGMVFTAFITGFLVSLLEAVCTGQLYLPTITFMLKNPQLKVKAFIYLVLYNFMFVIPLFLVLLFALLGTTSEKFSSFMKRHFIAIKLFMAGLFIILGLFIIFKV